MVSQGFGMLPLNKCTKLAHTSANYLTWSQIVFGIQGTTCLQSAVSGNISLSLYMPISDPKKSLIKYFWLVEEFKLALTVLQNFWHKKAKVDMKKKLPDKCVEQPERPQLITKTTSS
jgi:hypothetical protein